MDSKLFEIVDKLKKLDALQNDEICSKRFNNCLYALGKGDYDVAKFYFDSLKKDILYLVHGEDDEYSYVKAFVNLENYINRLYIRNYEKYLKD